MSKQPVNMIELEGNLVADPTFKTLDNGSRVATVQVANNQYYGKDPQTEAWKQATAFVTVEMWNEAADKLKNFSKGDWVEVKGKLAQNNWEKEGKKMSMLFIRGQSIENVKERKAQAQEHDGGR